MKLIAALVPLAVIAVGCSEPPPPPAPPKPQAVAPEPAAAPAPAMAKAAEAPKPPEPPRVDPNKELAAKVKEALEAPEAKLPGGAIDVTAADGKVTLWGALPSEGAVRRAARVAGKVDGVKSVDNQLKVVRGS